jgi:arabinogalactan endo-1,4-beta-galactosidase
MITRYGKEIIITEVGMSWDSPTESKAFVADLIAKSKAIANNKVLGVLYWEPQSYGSWQGYTKGAFDNTGKPTIALDAFK